jgi:hypothetical protein
LTTVVDKKARRNSLPRRTLRCRGDWTPSELFLQGAAGVEPHIRRLIIVFVQRTARPN